MIKHNQGNSQPNRNELTLAIYDGINCATNSCKTCISRPTVNINDHLDMVIRHALSTTSYQLHRRLQIIQNKEHSAQPNITTGQLVLYVCFFFHWFSLLRSLHRKIFQYYWSATFAVPFIQIVSMHRGRQSNVINNLLQLTVHYSSLTNPHENSHKTTPTTIYGIYNISYYQKWLIG